MLGSLLDILFPPVCLLCNAALAGDGFCKTCTSSLEKITAPLCALCGVPFPSPVGPSKRFCSVCITSKNIPYVSARSVLYYKGGLIKAIHDFKYYGNVALKLPLGAIMAEASKTYRVYREAVNEELPGDGGGGGGAHDPFFLNDGAIVTAVPLHKERLRERGYNQSLLLAEELAGRFPVELDRNLLKRVRLTRPQVELKGKERRQNVRGAFEVTPGREFYGKDVLLIDDVYTTGATVTECARILKEQGARVCVLTLARAVSI